MTDDVVRDTARKCAASGVDPDAAFLTQLDSRQAVIFKQELAKAKPKKGRAKR